MGTSKKKNRERQRRRYTKEFKLEAVRLLELGQTPTTQLALELGHWCVSQPRTLRQSPCSLSRSRSVSLNRLAFEQLDAFHGVADYAPLGKLRQGPAQGLGGQGEIAGNVVLGHGQAHFARLMALAERNATAQVP